MNTKTQTSTKADPTNIMNIKEDLLDNESQGQGTNNSKSLAKPIEPMNRLVQKEIEICATHIDVEPEELQAWIDCQVQAPQKSILHLLRTARKYGLDLLQEEVMLTQYKDSWHVSISFDGWIKLLHQHPNFSGVTFTTSPESENQSQTWMECTIYRSDHLTPTTIREYLSEVQMEGEVWKKMPKRMLRHRTLQQCARLALGINLAYSIDDRKKELPKTLRHTSRENNAIRQSTNQLHNAEKLKKILRNQP